jgi:glycosyltransferase involved in cell wall biosynthesis
MKVLMDAAWLVNGPISGHNVVEGLIKAWHRIFPQDTLVLASPHWKKVPMDLAPGVPRLSPRAWLPTNGGWVMTALGRAISDADLVISQYFTPLWRRGKKTTYITYIHDTIFFEHPEWHTLLERIYLSAIRPAARFADYAVTSTQVEVARIKRVWPELQHKVHAVGLGLPEGVRFSVPVRPELLQDDSPFIFAVGRLNIRKNLRRFIEAYARLQADIRQSFRVFIAGNPDGRSGITESNIENVTWLGRVTDGELRWLYEHATLMVFPSLDEGFGLPLIEAAFCGTPTLCSDIPPFREVAPEAGFFDPMSVDSMVQCLEDALQSEEVRRHYVPVLRADVFSWESVVRRIRALAEARES